MSRVYFGMSHDGLQEMSEVILEALTRVDFNQTRAADLLGTTRRILKYRMDKLGIQQDGEA